MSLKTILTLAAAGAAASAANAQQFWTVGSSTLATDISSNGVVVGGNASTGQYFLWTAGGGAINIGGQVAGSGVGGQASISADGMWVGGTNLNSVSNAYEIGRYNVATGTWSALGGIGGQSGVEISSGWGISGDGQTQVGLGWISAGGAHAVSWSNGVMTDLGSTVAGRSTRANSTNYDGSVVVGWQDSSTGFRQGAVWVNGQQQLIVNSSGNRMSEAYSASDDGRWVSGISIGGISGPPGNLWVWDTQTQEHTSLGNLATGGLRSIGGTAINSDGSLIVGGTWGLGPATLGTAIAWTADTGVIRFDDYLDSLGVVYEDGFTFNFVSDMSSDGQWFTGWGRTASGQATSFVVNVPTPATLPAVAIAGLFAARRRRA